MSEYTDDTLGRYLDQQPGMREALHTDPMQHALVEPGRGAHNMSLLHLPTIPVPPEVSHVDGCSCNGLDRHLKDCSIFSVPVKQAQEAIAAAHQRLREHTEELNRQLHAELAALRDPKGRP